eukprot:2949401-Amphidinium_carterae.2
MKLNEGTAVNTHTLCTPYVAASNVRRCTLFCARVERRNHAHHASAFHALVRVAIDSYSHVPALVDCNILLQRLAVKECPTQCVATWCL